MEAIQWVSGPVRLACFGDETIALTGKLMGCFAALTAITLLQSGCELRPTDYVPPESFEPSGLILRFADVSLNSPANGETVTLRGRFDHEAASDCTWPDDAGLGEQEPPHPELVVLWCRMEFVITAAAQPG